MPTVSLTQGFFIMPHSQVIRHNSSSSVPNPFYPKPTVSPSPLTPPQCPPPLSLRVWVSSSTARCLSTHTSITQPALHISTDVTLIVSAHLSPLTPLPSWSALLSTPTLTTVTLWYSLVPLTNPFTSANWSGLAVNCCVPGKCP